MRRRRFLEVLALTPALGLGAKATAARRRIAQLGTGHAHAAGKFTALRALPDLFEVVGIAEPEESRRTSAARTPAYEGATWREEADLLADPTILAVAVETALEAVIPTALRALRAGKHLHLDKPGGVDHAAFALMRREAEQRNRVVQLGYMLRHNPGLILVREAVEAGWLGEITRLDAGMGKLADETLRQVLRSHPGHGMMELGCHLVDLIVTLLGAPTSIQASGEASRPDGLLDRQKAVFSYPRRTATLSCDHADPSARRWLTLEGTHGAILVPALEANAVNLDLLMPRGPYPRGVSTVRRPAVGRYEGEFRELARLIDGERTRWDAAHDIVVHAASRQAAGLA